MDKRGRADALVESAGQALVCAQEDSRYPTLSNVRTKAVWEFTPVLV